MGTRFLNWAMKKGGTIFELWRIWAVTKSLIRLIWCVPYALLHRRGLKKLSYADDIWFADDQWHLSWQRDGLSLRGSRGNVIIALIRKRVHTNIWVTKSAMRHIRENIRKTP